MLEIDLSTLGPGELKRLGKTARARGNGHLADRVDWELAKRADRSPDTVAAELLPPSRAAGAFVDTRGPRGRNAPAFDLMAARSVDSGASWRVAALLALGVVAGSAATMAGLWTLERSARPVQTALNLAEPTSAAAFMARTTEAPATLSPPLAGAQPAAHHEAEAGPESTPETARARPNRGQRVAAVAARPRPAKTQRAAKPQPAPPAAAADTDSLAALYERGVQELDAAKGRPEEPFY